MSLQMVVIFAEISDLLWQMQQKKREFYKAVRGVQKENASVQVNAECIHSQSVQLWYVLNFFWKKVPHFLIWIVPPVH